MTKQNLLNPLRRLGTAILLLGFIAAIPVVYADDDDDDKETKIKIKDNKVKIKGKNADRVAAKMLKPEVTSTFVDGYTVPSEYHSYFTPLPAVEGDAVIRYYGGRAYYVNPTTWTINRVVDVNPSVEVEARSEFVEGYVIPETQRTTFVEVPTPDAGLTVRYYNDTAYYMDPSYRIVRTVRLTR